MADVRFTVIPGVIRNSVLEGGGVGDVTDVNSIEEGFAPVAKVHRGGVDHATNHLEVDSDGLFSNTVLFGGVGICCFVLDAIHKNW